MDMYQEKSCWKEHKFCHSKVPHLWIRYLKDESAALRHPRTADIY